MRLLDSGGRCIKSKIRVLARGFFILGIGSHAMLMGNGFPQVAFNRFCLLWRKAVGICNQTLTFFAYETKL